MSSLIKRIEILGVPMHAITDEDLPAAIDACFEHKTHRQIILLDFHNFMLARHSKMKMKILLGAALVIPVSSRITRAARFLKKEIPPVRRPYPFVIRLLTILENRNRSVYLLGLDMVGVRNAEAVLKATFPGLRIVGRYTARFNKERENDVVTAIRKASPSLLLIGRGRKQSWISRNRLRLSPGLSLWEQSSLDVFSGRKPKPDYSLRVRFFQSLFAFFIMPWRILRLIRLLLFHFRIVMEYLRPRDKR